eukprot:scaffold24294_cov186-Cylindrotheca_fusiformis.AAC.3
MASDRKKEILNFVEALGKSCASDASSFDPKAPLVGLTPSMASLHGSLRQMITWVDDFPPTNASTARFGNPAFRTWHQRLLDRSNAIITACLLARDSDLTPEEASQKGWDAASGILEAEDDPAIQQVSCYLHDAFGHAVRLDYGTGHESSFLVFLLVLSKVKCFGETTQLETLGAITLSIFDQYLQVTRRLQTDYRLEPAGSHGVWGLDDYHCLPFYFGACQLQVIGIDSQLTSPNCINDEAILKEFGDSFLYISCIRYIRKLKKGVPFFESSPMLYDISQTMPSWDKVGRGMIRLYQGEVLDKLQVVQHFVFSKYFPATWKPSQNERTAPTENFRSPTPGGNPAEIPVTRAPWATSGSPSSLSTPPTRAPWTNDSDVGPTTAPWAKQT